MVVQQALATVREAPFIVDVLRAADDLALAAVRNGGHRAAELLTAAAEDGSDELTAIAAVHALGRLFDDEADAQLSNLLSHDRGFLREHASWALGSRLPRLDAIGRLIAVVTTGGFSGMLAQRTLAHWARSASDHVALALEGAIAVQSAELVRARLVETLGLVPGDLAGRAVARMAADRGEESAVRIAAVAALGDRSPRPSTIEVITGLAGEDGELGAVARLAAIDVAAGRRQFGHPRARNPGGLSIAQLFLHADLDRELSQVGIGDNGGVATLLLRLGDALAAQPEVSRVLTLSRGSASEAALALAAAAGDSPSSLSAHLLAAVPLLRTPTDGAQAWPARVAAERGIRRALIARGPVDVLHLRMADVGTLAAAAVAKDLGIPVVFTLAPDPHAVIHALDMTGELARDNFGAADERQHYWFRARLVQRMAANAAHNVLFPRPELNHDLRELLGIEVAQEPARYTVVPEGIDLAVSQAARAEVAQVVAKVGVARERSSGTTIGAGAVGQLRDLIAALAPDRHGLPLALSVGRLNPVKGMAAVVQAWATDPSLVARCNLVIVGGDLVNPSPDERGQLELIRAIVPPGCESAAGLVLAGHRPNDVVARWLAAAQQGLPPLIGARGAYLCGSLKEEFGLAVLEALAAGLVVVAPAGGGPATYVEPDVTGFLVNTAIPGELATGMHAALDLAAGPGNDQRIERATTLIRDGFTVEGMARSLAGIYASVPESASRR